MYSVYLMVRTDGVFKIGISKNPNHRKSQLKSLYKQEYFVVYQTENKYNLTKALVIESAVRLYFFNRSNYSIRYKKSLDHFNLTQETTIYGITQNFIDKISQAEIFIDTI